MLQLSHKSGVSMALGLALGLATLALPMSAGAKLDRLLADTLTTRVARVEIGDWRSVEGLIVPGGSILRVHEALRLARLHPHLKVVLSGASDAEVAAALQAEATEGTRVYVERHALNTYENAVLSKQLVGLASAKRWLLVTTHYHMPRAIGSFHGAGFFVDPWPVVEAMDQSALSRAVRHEWGGLIYYRLKGRTERLLPLATATYIAASLERSRGG